MPRIVTVPLSSEQEEQLIHLTKQSANWRERQRAQTILWLAEGKTVAEVAALQNRIPETICCDRLFRAVASTKAIPEEGCLRLLIRKNR